MGLEIAQLRGQGHDGRHLWCLAADPTGAAGSILFALQGSQFEFGDSSQLWYNNSTKYDGHSRKDYVASPIC